jgi:acetyl esterase/lipase
MRRTSLSFALVLTIGATCFAADPGFTRKEDVIYGRKYGTALTMDVFTPTVKPNGAAVVTIISGGFYSSHEAISPLFIKPFLDRGYTVFTVVHGSQPRYTVPEIVDDLNRAVRFIRHNAKDYAIDPDRIGVTGASAGGHLSLMLGTAGSEGDPQAKDPVDRESSRVAAVACFFPPTDFLNYGTSGKEVVRMKDHAAAFRAAFDYRVLDPKTMLWVPVTDLEKRREIAKQISPALHVSADDAPTLIYHGDADPIVPVQQSKLIVEKLNEVGVPTKLVVKPGAGHGWLGMIQDISAFADWFDTYLSAPKTEEPSKPTSEQEGKP